MTTEAPERTPFDAEVIFANGLKAGLERAAEIVEREVLINGRGYLAAAIRAEKDKT